MRAAIVTTFYPNASEPARAPFVRNLASAMAQLASIDVVSPVPYAPPLVPIPRWRALRAVPNRTRDGEMTVVHPRYLVVPKCDALSGTTYAAGVFASLRRLRNAGALDILHAHCAYPDAVGVAAVAEALGLPFAVTTHGTDINVYSERPLIRGQLIWALRKASVVIAVSRELQRRVRDLIPAYAERVVYIPCAAADPALFTSGDAMLARAELGLDSHSRVALFVGRLVKIKAVDVLLTAWEMLRASAVLSATDRLVIIGDGPEREPLQAIAQRSGLAESVAILPATDQQSIARWMSAATVFCLSSRNEGTPNVIVEALASGRPVVASRVGGIPELIVEGRNGLLVESGNPIQFAEALRIALERTWDAADIAAGVAELTWDMLAKRNIAVLEDVLTARQGSAACVP